MRELIAVPLAWWLIPAAFVQVYGWVTPSAQFGLAHRVPPCAQPRPQPSHRSCLVMDLRLFSPQEMQIKRFVGQLGFMEVTDWEYYGGRRNPMDPDTPKRTVNTADTTVRLFEARAYDGTRVLMKEFPPEAMTLANNEVQVLERLMNSWESRGQDVGLGPPVTSLLGTLRSDQTFKNPRFIEKWVVRFPNQRVPLPGNLWLVYKWEGFSTFAAFPRAKQERDFWDILRPTDGRNGQRIGFVKEMFRSALEALAFTHEAGVVHRSIGSTSLQMSTLDERSPNQLRVKLADFGFASRISNLDQDTLERARRAGATSPLAVSNFLISEDFSCLGYVFLETLLASMATTLEDQTSSKPRTLDQTNLRRLVEDIYMFDLRGRFRDYCLEEDAWEPSVKVLDDNEGAGWALLEALICCRQTSAAPGAEEAMKGRTFMLNARALLGLPFFR